MKRVAVIGNGKLGIQFRHWIENYSQDTFVGFFDDYSQDSDVLGTIDALFSMEKVFDEVLIGVGYNHLGFKNNIARKLLENGIRSYTFIHSSAFVDSTAAIAEGVVIYPHATIDQGVRIGSHTVVNNAAIISHDSSIGSCCFIAPGVKCSGFVTIGAESFIGTGSIIKDSIGIAPKTTLGAGSLVLNPITESGVYYGHPIRIKQ